MRQASATPPVDWMPDSARSAAPERISTARSCKLWIESAMWRKHQQIFTIAETAGSTTGAPSSKTHHPNVR